MPYETNQPAAWWAGAEAAPPMPDAPGPWELGPTPYGWAWGRPEPDVPAAPFCPPGWAFVHETDSPPGTPSTVSERVRAWVAAVESSIRTLCPPESPAPAEVRVGDRLQRGHDIPRRVEQIVPYMAMLEIRTGDLGPFGARLSDIGPADSGKPWTLLPRDPVPDAPDADTAGIIREGMRALDRIEAQAQQLHAGGGGASVRHEPAPAGPDATMRERVRAFGDAYRAAPGCHDDSILPGLRAADAVPDPRREAERRVVEAARTMRRALGRVPYPSPVASAQFDLCGALDALANLDAEPSA